MEKKTSNDKNDESNDEQKNDEIYAKINNTRTSRSVYSPKSSDFTNDPDDLNSQDQDLRVQVY